jgi:hypothetical protein
MAGYKIIEFDAKNILNLLTHYTDGKLPLDAELLQLGVHTILNRHLGLLVESNQWSDPMLAGQEAYSPLFINYEGKKVMTWGTKDHKDIKWSESPS